MQKTVSTSQATTIPLQVDHLTVAYKDTPVLRDITVNFPIGKLTAIIGPNGAGKSTLLKAMLDLLPRIGGDVSVFGRPYRQQRQQVGYVPQRTSVDWLFPTHALDVVTMGTYGQLGWLRRPGKAQHEWALACLDKVGMRDFAYRQISQLSGGQQQRVFLARALAQNAEIYLMDEPFASVDAMTEQAIIRVLKEMREQGKTVICVHHDLESAPDYFDWAVLLNVTLVAAGPFAETFTLENLARTYGGHMQALSRLSQTDSTPAPVYSGND